MDSSTMGSFFSLTFCRFFVVVVCFASEIFVGVVLYTIFSYMQHKLYIYICIERRILGKLCVLYCPFYLALLYMLPFDIHLANQFYENFLKLAYKCTTWKIVPASIKYPVLPFLLDTAQCISANLRFEPFLRIITKKIKSPFNCYFFRIIFLENSEAIVHCKNIYTKA